MAHVITYDIDTKDLGDTPEGRNERTKLYQSVRKTLEQNGFIFIQHSVYRCDSDDLTNVFRAVEALKKLPDFVSRVDRLHHFEVTKTTNLKTWLADPVPPVGAA